MKAQLSKTVIGLILFSQTLVFANPTTISDIKDENIICFNISTLKTDAYAFKTTAPYKIWKAQLDSEGKIKTQKAFLLGNSEMTKDPDENYLKGFSAELTKKQKLAGTFNNNSQVDDDFTLTVITTHDDDGKEKEKNQESKGNIVSRYNCQLSKH